MKNNRFRNHSLEKNSSTTATYKTSDLYLSAFLKSKGTNLEGATKKKDKVIFIFQDDGDIEGLVNKYFNDSEVPVLRFKAALRDLRSIIFNYQNLRRKPSDKKVE